MRRETVTGLHMIAAEILHKHPKSTKIEVQNEARSQTTIFFPFHRSHWFRSQIPILHLVKKKKKMLPCGEV